MSVFSIPAVEESPWPTLGPAVVEVMEQSLVFGPGDLRRQPYRVDEEDRALIYRMYEVFPKDHPHQGRRRFNRACISRRKGTAKSELLAAIAAVELHPEAPVRCDGWRRRGRSWEPVGRPVTDPYIPLVAYTEEQSDDLAYAALLVMLGEGPAADLFDIGLERIMRRSGDGKAVSLAGSPSARDGARTTFQGEDETHRFTSQRLRDAHRTMLANLPKRIMADPWGLETTTRPEPGAGSVAEETEAYARAVAEGKVRDSRLLFYLREASDSHDLDTEKGRMDALVEATAESKRSWSNFPAIAGQWQDPEADTAYLERVWMNRRVVGSSRAFDIDLWTERAVGRPKDIPDGALVALGFDGSRYDDHAALIGTEVASGFQWPLGIWRPEDHDGQIPEDEVEAIVEAAFAKWDVIRLYADDDNIWRSTVKGWTGRWGKDRVHLWPTRSVFRMSGALRSWLAAMRAGDLSHCPVADALCGLFTTHVGNARRKDTGYRDDHGPLWTVSKERADSDRKIDSVIAAALSWEARNDAIAAGALNIEDESSVYETDAARIHI